MIKLQKNRMFFQCICNRNLSQLNDNVWFKINVTSPKHQPFEFHHIKLSTFIFPIFKRELFFFCSNPTSQMKGKSWISHRGKNMFKCIYFCCMHSFDKFSIVFFTCRPLVSSIYIFAFFFFSFGACKAKMAKIHLPKMCGWLCTKWDESMNFWNDVATSHPLYYSLFVFFMNLACLKFMHCMESRAKE